MRYWDSSALVPVIIAEEQSRGVKQLLAADAEITTWWGSEVECASAIARHEHAHGGGGAFEAAYAALAEFSRGWLGIVAAPAIKELAIRILRLHNLRAADALQLAAALAAAQHRPSELPFVCFDLRLRAAARKEGFAVLPE